MVVMVTVRRSFFVVTKAVSTVIVTVEGKFPYAVYGKVLDDNSSLCQFFQVLSA